MENDDTSLSDFYNGVALFAAGYAAMIALHLLVLWS